MSSKSHSHGRKYSNKEKTEQDEMKMDNDQTKTDDHKDMNVEDNNENINTEHDQQIDSDNDNSLDLNEDDSQNKSENSELDETDPGADQVQNQGDDDERSATVNEDKDDSNCEDDEIDDHDLEPCEPEDFNSKAFVEITTKFIEKFESDVFKDLSSVENYPTEKLKSLTEKANVHVREFYNYSLFMQNNLHKLRSKMRILCNKIRETIPGGLRERENKKEELSIEEKELIAKLESFKGELAQTNVELNQAIKLHAESEFAATEAALSARRAADQATKLKEAMEEQYRLEEQAIKREEERRAAKEAEKRRKQEEREARELKEQKEVENRSQSRRAGVGANGDTRPPPVWENWPPTTYNADQNDFNQGIACIVRGDTKIFNEEDIICEILEQTGTNFKYSPHDELISCIIRIRPTKDESDDFDAADDEIDDQQKNDNGNDTDNKSENKSETDNEQIDDNKEHDINSVTEKEDKNDDTHKEDGDTRMNDNDIQRKDDNQNNMEDKRNQKMEHPIYVAIPHCLSRYSAISREPVIKANIDGTWTDLITTEVTFEQTKDLKFAQVELKQFTSLAVVCRFKRDFVKFSTKGGKIISSVDSRITLTTEKGTFDQTEHFTVQVQPIESHSISDLRIKDIKCKGLLASSAIINLEWESDDIETFNKPIQLTLPCPPNPARARKAAAMRAIKEAKMKNPRLQIEDHNKKPEQKPENGTSPNRWYMGEYGSGDDDENDNIYLFSWNEKTKWQPVSNVNIQQIRLDLLQLELREPVSRFLVIRVRTTVSQSEARHIITTMDSYLTKRTVRILLKQRNEEPSDVCIHCVPHNSLERLIQLLREDGYNEGPAPSKDIMISEGDIIKIGFRGNLKNIDNEPLQFVYNSHLNSSLDFVVSEVDKYLQKNYPVYRGFAQVYQAYTDKKAIEKDKKRKEDENKFENEEKKELLCELLVNIPKYHTTTPSPPNKAPITIVNAKDPINEHLIRHFAKEIGDEWQKLAYYLNVKKVRLQAILRNNEHLDRKEKEEETRYDMMMTWVKKVPRGIDKVSMLKKALLRCERVDLVEELEDRNREFLAQKA